MGAVIAVFLMAIFYEGLKSLREYLVYLDYKHSKSHTSILHRPKSDNDLDDDTDRGELLGKRFPRIPPKE